MYTSKDGKTTASADAMTNEGGSSLDGAREPKGYFSPGTSDTIGKDNWENTARRTGHHVRELADTAKHSLSHAGEAITARIRDNPVQSSFLALGFGLLFGMIYRR